MKIIFNTPKKENERINKMITKIKNVRAKIETNEQKLSYKHYMLLFLMVAVGILSLALNIRENKEISKENYDTYMLQKDVPALSDDADSVQYITAMSSIYEEKEYINNEEKKEKNISAQGKYIYPTKGEIIKPYTSEELVLSKTLDMWMTHEGIDIKSKLGNDVYAIQNGSVDSVYEDALYGQTVIINHENNITSVYCNLANELEVKEGDKVNKGEKIGEVGNTAIVEIGDEPHIHLEILKDGIKINPDIIGLK